MLPEGVRVHLRPFFFLALPRVASSFNQNNQTTTRDKMDYATTQSSSPSSRMERRGTIALANTTVLALAHQILNGNERTRHQSYGSLWRLVQSSSKLQLSVFDTLVRQELLQQVMNDTESYDRGVRQASSKLLLHLVHKSHHIQREITTQFPNRVLITDIYCEATNKFQDQNHTNNHHNNINNSSGFQQNGGYLCLLSCGEKLQHHKSMLTKLQQTAVGQVNETTDFSALGSSIATATHLSMEHIDQYERGHSVTLPPSQWMHAPIDPCNSILAFVDFGHTVAEQQQKQHGKHGNTNTNTNGTDKTKTNSTTKRKEHKPPHVVEKHMHRWKDHVSRSLLNQLSVLHDIYRTATVVERRKNQKNQNLIQNNNNIPTGSVSMAIMGQVFRYACSEAGKSRAQRGGVSKKNAGGLLPAMTRVVADEMGIRKIPSGLRGVVLFDDTLVSKHDDIFTAVDGRLASWNAFRRYWVHRWATDRLVQQLGIDVCKTLLDSFDDAVDSAEDSNEIDRSNDELKVPCDDLYNMLATEVFLSGHLLREIFLAAVEPDDIQNSTTEDQISWGIYIHALIFRLHESHRHLKTNSVDIRGFDGEIAKASGFSSGDSSGGDSTDSDEEELEMEIDRERAREREMNGEVEMDENVAATTNNNPTESSLTVIKPGSSSQKLVQPKLKKNVIENNNNKINSNKRRKQRRGAGDFKPGSFVNRGQSRLSALIKRLASKQRDLRNSELELLEKDDEATTTRQRRSPKKKQAAAFSERERLRGRVHHLRRQCHRLNRKVAELSGNEHALVTISSGISLVEEATRIARSEDAKSLHRQRLVKRVAQNKMNLKKANEKKRKLVEKKAKQKFDKFDNQNKNSLNTIRRPASAAPGGRRPQRRSTKKTNGMPQNNRRPMSAGITRTRMGNRNNNKRLSSPRSDGTTNNSSNSNTLNTTNTITNRRRKQRPEVEEEEEEDDAAKLDQRMHDFGMPGYGTSRAWKEMKRFFNERVRLNKANAERVRKKNQKLLWKREKSHLDRVTRRKNARTRTSHQRHVKANQLSEQQQEAKKQRIEMELLRKDQELQDQHQNDMNWIQSARFSPRARSVAYDSMRRLTIGSDNNRQHRRQQRPGTAGAQRSRYDSHSNTANNATGLVTKRPMSANPRLRNNSNNRIRINSTTDDDLQQQQQRHRSGSSASFVNSISTNIMPTRPNNARPRSVHAGRGAKYDHLVAELEDAKMLLGYINQDVDLKKQEKEAVEKDLVIDLVQKNPESVTKNGEESAGKAQNVHKHETSVVNKAIISAVQLQMLRQWPQQKMSLRVRHLVHSQLNGRAKQRAKNIELDHATQRLNDKSAVNKNVVDISSSLPPRGASPTKRLARENISKGDKKLSETSQFVANLRTNLTGASPLIKFRRMTSGANL